MIVGKLYKCPKYYLLFYPTKEKVLVSLGSATVATRGSPAATTAADYWSVKLDCKVHYSEPNEVFMCLKQEGRFVCVLFGDLQGWFINKNWLEVERVK